MVHFSLTAAEQRELNSRMERKQMKEFMTVIASSGFLSFGIYVEHRRLTFLMPITDVLQIGATMLRPLRE